MSVKEKFYDDYNKEKLIARIKELEEHVKSFKQENTITDDIHLPLATDLGRWNWMVQSDDFEFDPRIITNLGYLKSDIPDKVGLEFFTEKLHPKDYKRITIQMKKHMLNLNDFFDSEYRLLKKDGTYAWYYERSKVTARDDEGKALIISGILFDITKSKTVEENLIKTNLELEKLVHKDDLTKTYNRRFMMTQIQNEIDKYKSNKECFSLIMLDVDDFKNINGLHGHNTGDLVLINLAKCITKRINKTDFLSRWGGDEFIILMPSKDLEYAIEVAKGIRGEIENCQMNKVNNINISMGVTLYQAGDSKKMTIRKVDDLMYTAKAHGKNYISYEKNRVI